MLNRAEYIRYLYRIMRTSPRRYSNLYKTIFEHRCRRMLEIGTYDGIHAAGMIQTAAIFYPADKIEYVGVDLFERLTPDKAETEFAKRPPPISEAERRLKKTNARITLYQGDSREVLPREKKDMGIFDFIFIDGGHSGETVSSDWDSARDLMNENTVVIFDDYYPSAGRPPDNAGCMDVIHSLDRSFYDIEILQPSDKFVTKNSALEINFVRVRKKRK